MEDMVKGDLRKIIISKSIPMGIGMLAVMIFSLVDTYFVSLLGDKELAAMGYIVPVLFGAMSISIGLSIGTSAVVSKTIGQKKDAAKIATHGLLLAFLVVCVVSAIGLAVNGSLFELLGAQGEVLVLTGVYMGVFFWGLPFLVIPQAGNGIIRATGNMKIPAYIMITVGVLNALLDYLLIFGIGPFPELGFKGAAVATVISWFFSFIAAGVVLIRMRLLSLDFSSVLSSWKEIFLIAIPAMGTQILQPILFGILTYLLSRYGDSVVAAYGIITRVEMFSLIGVMALGAVMTPLVGQHFGANRWDRIRKIQKIVAKYAMVYGGVAYIVLMLGAITVSGIFTDNPAIAQYIIMYFWIVPISYGFFGITHANSAMCNGMQQPLIGLSFLFTRDLLFIVPLAIVGLDFIGVTGLFLGIALGNILSGSGSFFYLMHHIKHHKSL